MKAKQLQKRRNKRKRKGQIPLPGNIFKIQKQFGGVLLKKSNPKTARPISTKLPMHIVLRSSLAKGRYSLRFNNNAYKIKKTIQKQARNFHIELKQYANAGNHLHLLVKVHSRVNLKRFLRAISGLIARLVLGVERGFAKGIKFWDYRPWSRIVESWRGYLVANDYVIQNHLETIGMIPYKRRKRIRSSGPNQSIGYSQSRSHELI